MLNHCSVTNLLHGLGVDKVLRGPNVGVLVHAPLEVDVEEGQMVRLGHLELLPLRVRVLESIGRYSKRDVSGTE